MNLSKNQIPAHRVAVYTIRPRVRISLSYTPEWPFSQMTLFWAQSTDDAISYLDPGAKPPRKFWYIKWQKDSAGRTFKLRKCLKWIKNSKIDQKFKNGEKIGTFWIRHTNGSEPFCTVAETPILIGFDDLAFLYCILEGFQIWKSENWKSENRKILASGFFRNLSKSIPQAGGAP